MMPSRQSYVVDREVATYNASRRKEPVLDHDTAVHTMGMIPERGNRGFNYFQDSAARLAEALGLPVGTNWSKADCRQKFHEMDRDNSGEIDATELQAWILKNNLFPASSLDEAKRRIAKTFEVIDKSGDGQLNFNEFYSFCKLVEKEQRLLHYASRHYMTELPASMHESNPKRFTLAHIEKELHAKVEQFTSKDTDRFRQILGMFKSQVQRSRADVPREVLSISEKEFQKVLAWLGLFATHDQAVTLFRKFDQNGDGRLTVHEFLTRARPSDYPNCRRSDPKVFNENKGGKKIFKNNQNGENIPRVKTPPSDVYAFTMSKLAHAVRDKMSSSGKVGLIYPDSQGRRDLLLTFHFFDKKLTGVCKPKDFFRALQMVNVNSLGDRHMEMCYDRFANDDGMMDYRAFAGYCYPNFEKTPNEHLQGTALDIRGREYTQNPHDGSFVFQYPAGGRRTSNTKQHLGPLMNTGRSSSQSSARSTRSMAHSASAGAMGSARSVRSSQSGRSMGRSTSTKKIESLLHHDPNHEIRSRIRVVKPSQQVNPLMAERGDQFRSKPFNKNALSGY